MFTSFRWRVEFKIVLTAAEVSLVDEHDPGDANRT
jgi:hypothetical protein